MRFIQAKHYTVANRGLGDVSLVCIHTAECGETLKADENVAAYFAGPNAPKASAHYTVDTNSVTQSVLEKDIAWHAGPINAFSVGIEHAGFAKQSDAEWADDYSLAMLERSAKLVATICTRHQIPIVKLSADELKEGRRRGLCGHVDVTNGLTGGRGHWDPGPSFPWQWYLERVQHLASHEETAPRVLTDNPAFVEIEHAGQTWQVASLYVAPIGIGEAAALAAKLGYELPTKDLVDAIWQAADMKIDAIKMTRADHDGTIVTMDSPDTHAAQALTLERELAGRSLGVDFRLLAGPFKDIIRREDGAVGIYGWHRLDGSVIQPPFFGHALSWRDYSQALRLVKRKS